MRLEHATVVSNDELYQDTFLMWLSCPPVAKGAAPGRFLMIRCGDGFDPLLPRPMSFHRFRTLDGDPQFAILFDVRGRGTRWLSGRRPGQTLRLFGPLGQGYRVAAHSQNLLLVGGGIGVAALVALADEAVASGRAVTVLHGARTAQKLFPASLLPTEVEVLFATEDGSAGHRGYVTDLVPGLLHWADQIFACGPAPMFSALAEVLRAQRSRKPAQALLEERMGCGTGICYGCAVQTRRGMRLVCKDGPQFELREVFG